jgi:hypothetical protein
MLARKLGRPLKRHERACHTCDRPVCINPDHLWLGTDKQNLEDMTRKGRRARGERMGTAKLTEADVRLIRELVGKLSMVYLGHWFGVSKVAVRNAAIRRTWKHVI